MTTTNSWENYKNDCTTENLVKIAREAGFSVHEEKLHKFYSIIGNDDTLRRFYQMTAGQILMDMMAREAEALDLYNTERLQDNG